MPGVNWGDCKCTYRSGFHCRYIGRSYDRPLYILGLPTLEWLHIYVETDSSVFTLYHKLTMCLITAKYITWWEIDTNLKSQNQCAINNYKENIKAPRHWHLCGEFTVGRWISRTKRPETRKFFPFVDVIMMRGNRKVYETPWHGNISHITGPLCEGIHTHTALMCCMLLSWTNYWTNSRIYSDLTRHVAHMTSL